MTAALIVTVGTVGHVNHTVALTGLLREAGVEDVTWIVGEGARGYVESLRLPWRVHYTRCHDLDFDKTRPGRRSHLEQMCERSRLEDCVGEEERVAGESGAGVVVTKDFVSPIITAARLGRPLMTYFTDGPGLLFADSNPQANAAEGLTRTFRAVAHAHGVRPPDDPVPLCLRSADLSVVRGFPETSSVPVAQLAAIADRIVLSGATVFDGNMDSRRFAADLATLRRPVLGVTFGTVCYDVDRYLIAIRAAERWPGSIVLTALHCADELRGAAGENVSVFEYVPVEVLLSYIDAIVHHGGHGTFLSAVTRGVPQVVIPDNTTTAGQRAHAETVERLGVGVHVRREDLDPRSFNDAGLAAVTRAEAAARLGTVLRHRDVALRTDAVHRIRSFLTARAGGDR